MALKLYITIDTREKQPFHFPAFLPVLKATSTHLNPVVTTAEVVIDRRQLPISDYLLEYREEGIIYTEPAKNACVLERKASLSELYANLFNPERRKRFLYVLDLLAQYPAPVLFLEAANDLLKPDRHCPLVPAAVLDELQRVLFRHKIRLYLGASGGAAARRSNAEWVARTLWNHQVVAQEKDGHGLPTPTDLPDRR